MFPPELPTLLLSFFPKNCGRPRLRNPEQFPIERLPFCMDLVVKKVWKQSVVAPRTVGAPLSTNHELTQASREMICGVGGRRPLREEFSLSFNRKQA